MLQSVYINKLGYKSLVILLDEGDNPAFGVPISQDVQDWLSPKAANLLWSKGFTMPKDFFRAGVHEAVLAAVKIDHPHLDKKSAIIKANMIVEAIRLELS